MIEIECLINQRESRTLEVKESGDALPRSIWETYSSFANTSGGIILLGIKERKDKSLEPIGVNDPESIIKVFWDTVNNRQKVSNNILSYNDVSVVKYMGVDIVCIEIPRANRFDKPVYINGNLFAGTYRRDGEGDFHCTEEEVRSMVRDQASISQDIKVLETMNLEALDLESIKRYRMRMENKRAGHVWEELSDESFLYKIGALGRDKLGILRPTAAGLLMFGHEYEIVREFPNYFLDYQEKLDPSIRWSDRLISSSGEWSGNLYDFYFRVYTKLIQDVKVPFSMDDKGNRIEHSPIHKALREALANCLINADYYGRGGITIKKTINTIEISNPGCFRINIEEAISGGISDPRNGNIMKMFNLISIGERSGSGLPNIYNIWRKNRFLVPVLQERVSPERVKLLLSLDYEQKATIKSDDKKATIKSDDKHKTRKTVKQEEEIIQYLQLHDSCNTENIKELLNLQDTRAKELIKNLIQEEKVIACGSNKNRVYMLSDNKIRYDE